MKDIPDLSGLSPSGEPFFAIRGCDIRYNPRPGEHGVALSFDPPEGSRVDGTITFSGFTLENGAILGCHFRLDDTLAPGTIAIAPLSKEETRAES
jgi:hypothetical protein